MRKSWDEYFKDIVKVVSSRSKDPSTKVGAVIVGERKQIISCGYNGIPRGCEDKMSRMKRGAPDKYYWMEHAERNAIYNAIDLSGAVLYTQWIPCPDCMRGIIQVGIKRIVITSPEIYLQHWDKRVFQISLQMCKEAGVTICDEWGSDIDESIFKK